MKCSECGKENVQGAVFCANCGAQLTRRSVNVNGGVQEIMQGQSFVFLSY